MTAGPPAVIFIRPGPGQHTSAGTGCFLSGAAGRRTERASQPTVAAAAQETGVGMAASHGVIAGCTHQTRGRVSSPQAREKGRHTRPWMLPGSPR